MMVVDIAKMSVPENQNLETVDLRKSPHVSDSETRRRAEWLPNEGYESL